MPDKTHLPDENPETQPSPPHLPPELPDDDYTRVQGEQSKTKGMPPIQTPRPVPTPPRPQRTVPPPPPREARRERPAPPDDSRLPEKPKRGQPPPPKTKTPAPRSGLYLPVWSVALTLMLVCGAVSCIVLAVLGLGGRTAPAAAPQFLVITAIVPTNTAFVPDSLIASPVPNQLVQTGTVPAFSLVGPTLPPVVISPTPDSIAVGKGVVVDSEESGLNVRSEAGIQNELLFVADDGEPFTIVDGPTQADGFTWWKIQSPNDPTRAGWAAAVYLELLSSQQP
jgi:hypothetical protein